MRLILLACLFCLIQADLRAQLSISAVNTPFTIDFDNTVSGVNNGAFNGSGFTPAPSAGQLNSDAWAVTGLSDGPLPFGGTETAGDFARGPSTGGVSTGGIYAFEVSPNDFTLGVQPTGSDFSPGTFTLRVQNNTGSILTSIDLLYDIYVYDNGGYSNNLNFSYSEDDLFYSTVPALDYDSPSGPNPSPSWSQISRSTTVYGLYVSVGGYFYVRWEINENFGTGTQDELAIDNISLTAYSDVSSPGDILITEILYDASSEPGGEWFEIYNATASTINLEGWKIADALSTVTINYGGPFNINPGQYMVFARSTGGCTSADYTYGSIDLNNNGDRVTFLQGATTIDEVDYSSGFPGVSDGQAIQLDDETNQDATTNDNGANWCVARTPCGSDFGTPGAVNDNCCYFSSVTAFKFCDDNGTSANTADDQYYITLDPDGDGFGSNYSISGDINDPSQSYSGQSDLFGLFPISQTLNLTLTDNEDNTCMTGLSVSPPPHCSYDYDDLFITSQFVNPCGDDGRNEFGIFYTQNDLNIADLAYASSRNTADLTNIWLGNNYGGSPASIPGYSGSESCGPGVLFCYDWLYPSNSGDATIINNVISQLNTIAGCTVFLPVPATDIIPAGSHVAAFFAGGACTFENPGTYLDFSGFCSGDQIYLLLGNAASCGTAGFFENAAPRVALISDGAGTDTRSFYFSGISGPTSVGILTLTSQIEGIAPPLDCVPTPDQLLPVELSYFEARAEGAAALLSWGTASEIDNAYFDIERSGDGRAFSTIGRIAGAGTTDEPQAYRFTDVSPLPGANYYRLRQVDFGGAAAYSPVRVLHFPGKTAHWRLSPTLARQNLRLSCAAPLEDEHTLYILNTLGRPVATHRLQAGLSEWTIPTSQLPPGAYWLSGLPDSAGAPLRFIKME